MKSFYNKKFRHTTSRSMYVDEYLGNQDEVKELASMGIDVYPRDENDMFVPLDKQDPTPHNLSMIEHTICKAYGV